MENEIKITGIVLAAIATFMSPIWPLLLLVAGFVAADTVAGIYAAKKNGEGITSNKFARILGKIVMYSGGVLLTRGMEMVLEGFYEFPVELMLTKLAVLVICFVELFSIDEKIRKVNGEKGLVFYIVKVIRLLKKAKKQIDDEFKKERED